MKLIDQVIDVIRKKHYSIRTEEAFLQWINPQISQITQITMDVRWKLRKLLGLIPRSLLRSDRIYHTWIHRGLPRGGSFTL